MTHLARVVQFVAAILLMVLAACSGSSSNAADDGAPTTTATPSIKTAEVPPSEPDEVAAQEPVEPTSEPVEATTVQLWFPRQGIRSEVPKPDELVDRVVTFDEDSTTAQRLSTVVNLFIAGPTEAESANGLINFRAQFASCGQPFAIEATTTAAVVTLCPHRDPGSNHFLGMVLTQTLEMTGLVDEYAILYSNGDRCVVGFEQEDLLACLPEEFRDRLGFRCPFGRATTLAVVTGVDEWANTRRGPSIDEDVVQQVRVDVMVEAYPSTLSYDGTDLWWITVRVPSQRGQCASIAAQFLMGTFGNLGDLIPGVSFELPPSSADWHLAEYESVFDQARWTLSGGFETYVSLQVLAGKRIDEQLAQQLESFESGAFDYPDDWYLEADVVGADRAVRARFVYPESGGVETNELLIEVGDFTIVAFTGVHEGVVDRVGPEAVEVFLSSLRVDRDTFFDALTVPDEMHVTLHGIDYVVARQVDGGYNEFGICGLRYEFYKQDSFGLRTYAGWVRSTNLTELENGHLLWENYCEGAGPVSFYVGRIGDDGAIQRLGGVSGFYLGVRGEFGSHRVDADGTITFEGTAFGSDEVLTDTFTLDDLLAALSR